MLGNKAASLFALTGIILSVGPAATAQTAQTNLAVTVRHAPDLNGGPSNAASTAPTLTHTTANCSDGKLASSADSTGLFAGSSGLSANSSGLSDNPSGQSSRPSGLSARAFGIDVRSFGPTCCSNIYISGVFGLNSGSFGVAATPFGQSSGFSGLSAGSSYHYFPYF
jgi:hypothetical protein